MKRNIWFIIILILRLHSDSLSQTTRNGELVALKGCVIISQENKGLTSKVEYKKKCEFCSWVDNSPVKTALSNLKISIYSTNFICPKCKKPNEVKIQGIYESASSKSRINEYGGLVVLQGCVIINQENKGLTSKVEYKKKCEVCSWVDNSPVITALSNLKISIYSTNFICPKCKNLNEVRIQGNNESASTKSRINEYGGLVALQGCVIINLGNKSVISKVEYKKKCQYCAWIDGSPVITALSNLEVSTYSSYFICPKCKKKNELKIQGTK